ncbi:MAG TPA: hypothetical protein VFQ25_07290 [Ktedonobacterales bacterium]|nr:hypothetical protein [Ktedonobacterales bacterium]
MRQAIRVYAIVALVAMVAFVAAWLTHPASFFREQGWVDWTLGMVLGLQLWVLPVVPLGILAASDAARAGRRGWLALFIALLVLAPIAFWLNSLAFSIQILLFASPCGSGADCPGVSLGIAPFVTQAGWAVAFLSIPIAALVYSLTSARSVAERVEAAEASQGERRALSLWAIVGIVVMSALGYLATAHVLYRLFGNGSPLQVEKFLELQLMLPVVWSALAALPVAIASAALAHAARTGRWGWLAGWIALAALALLSTSPEIKLRMINPMMDAYILNNPWIAFFFPEPTGAITITPLIPPAQYIISIVAPVVIMLVALIYALTVMRPEQRAAAPAAA